MAPRAARAASRARPCRGRWRSSSLVASVAGVGALGPHRPTARRVRRRARWSTGGAIPSRIDDIPADLEATTDLAVGRGSAAFISASQRDPVVVTAADGVAHRLDLPGWSEDGQAFALSPDGMQPRVAADRRRWRHHRRAGARRPGSSGATRCTRLATSPSASSRWSPDSAWLGWLGDADGGAIVGRLPVPGADIDLRKRVEGNVTSLAIGNAADVVLGRANGGLYRLAEGETASSITRATGVGPGLYSPDARFVALRSGMSDASSTLRLSDGAVLSAPVPGRDLRLRRRPPPRLARRPAPAPAGVVTEEQDAELVVTTPQVGPTSTWRRSVGCDRREHRRARQPRRRPRPRPRRHVVAGADPRLPGRLPAGAVRHRAVAVHRPRRRGSDRRAPGAAVALAAPARSRRTDPTDVTGPAAGGATSTRRRRSVRTTGQARGSRPANAASRS